MLCVRCQEGTESARSRGSSAWERCSCSREESGKMEAEQIVARPRTVLPDRCANKLCRTSTSSTLEELSTLVSAMSGVVHTILESVRNREGASCSAGAPGQLNNAGSCRISYILILSHFTPSLLHLSIMRTSNPPTSITAGAVFRGPCIPIPSVAAAHGTPEICIGARFAG